MLVIGDRGIPAHETGVTMRLTIAFLGAALMSAHVIPLPSSLNCDLGGYRAQTGLPPPGADNQLVVTWKGARDAELRARYGIDNGQPLIRDLAVRKAGMSWATLGEHLKTEYRVVTGVGGSADKQEG